MTPRALPHSRKFHNGAHRYTRCDVCGHEFCRDYWTACPRCHTAPAAPFVDVSTITEYGLTQRLTAAVRVFCVCAFTLLLATGGAR